jgi:hypothetical protein
VGRGDHTFEGGGFLMGPGSPGFQWSSSYQKRTYYIEL